MSNAPRDDNRNTTILGVDSVTFLVPTTIAVDPDSHAILTKSSSGGSASTSTLSNVAGSATSVTLLASNTARLGGSIYNDSTAILYVKFGTPASTTSFNVEMYSNDYFEIPFNYSGIITGIWISATGAARVMEVTA